MKTALLILLAALPAGAAQGADPQPPPKAPAPRPAVGVPPDALREAVQKEGDAIVAQAFGLLSSRLGKAIADAGFTNAIEFCSVHGLTLTQSLGVTNEVALRRVTHRPRNPANGADTNELAILRRFEAELTRGTTPNPVVATNKPGRVSYYAPIVLHLPLCLSCHGNPGSDIATNVLAQIRRRYPADQATGFKQGQLRGMWSVDFKASDFAPLMNGSKPRKDERR